MTFSLGGNVACFPKSFHLAALTTVEINIHRVDVNRYETIVQCQGALERCRSNKGVIGETNRKQLAVLQEMSSWCLQDLGSKMNRTKIETLVTIQAISPSRWCWGTLEVAVRSLFPP